MDTLEEIISDTELDKVYGNANFGGAGDMAEKREVVRHGVLKCACGYYQGHTSTQIVIKLGLVDNEYKITPKGQRYLWLAFTTDKRF